MNCPSTRAVCLLCLVSSQVCGADSYFIEACWENNMPLAATNQGIAIWSGGNVGTPSDSPSAVVDEGSGPRPIFLVESAIGQIAVGNLGYPNALPDLLAKGETHLSSGSSYGTVDTLTGRLQRPAGAWDIVFPGVVDVFTGEPSNKPQNYRVEDILEAQRAFRAALRINPFETNAARGLLHSIYLQMVPLTFAGNNAYVYATRARLVASNPYLGETRALTNALGFFEQAAQVLVNAAANPADAQLLEGTYPYVRESLLAGDNLNLVDSFARAVALQGETLLRLVRIKYLGSYRDPSRPGFSADPLIALIEEKSRGLQASLAFANLFRRLEGFEFTELSKGSFHLQELMALRSPILQGRLSFSGYQETNVVLSAASQQSFREYSPRYIPFFFPQEAGNRSSSFRNLLLEADGFLKYSESADESAKVAGREWDSSTSKINQELSDISSRYRSELADLCGVIRDRDGNLQPDLFLSLLPVDDRLRIGREVLGDPSYLEDPSNNSGRLYQQWVRVGESRTRLSAAALSLENKYSEMEKKQEIADKIAQGQQNIAYLILEDGEKLQALDRQEGEVRAALSRALARIRATEAIVSGVAGVAGAMTADPAKWVGSTISEAGKAAAAAAAALAAGEEAARADKKLADIQAQRTRIGTLERAKIQFAQRDETLLRTEEAMHALMLETERLKLDVLLAEENLEVSQGELANMIARVSFLLQEYRSATQLVLSDPLASPDYRLIRDLQARAAEEAFGLAQEWIYLAVKAGQYRVNGAREADSITDLIGQVLAARRAVDLRSIYLNLQATIDRLQLKQGQQESVQRETISFRHYIVQNNYAITDTNGTVLPGSQLEATPAGVTSDQDWLNYLRSHVSTNQDLPQLDLVFSTGLNKPYRAVTNPSQGRRDFLFRQRLFNALLTYTPDSAGAYGVRVNIKSRLLDYDRTRDGELIINLRQEGASYVRTKPWVEDPSAVNVWDLEPVNAQVVPYLNGFNENQVDRRATPRFNERSPANDRWVLSIYAEGGNQVLLSNLEKINDIELEFNFTGYSR